MAPGQDQKGSSGKKASKPVIPAIPLPLMPKQKPATALGSPVARQNVQTPAQTPRNGTPDFPQENTNGVIGNVPPTPSSIADSTGDAPSQPIINGQTPPHVAAGAATAATVPNGEQAAAVQTPPQNDSPQNDSPPNSNSTVSSDESFDSPKSDETEPAAHSGGVLLLDRPDTMSPPFSYAGEGVPIHVSRGFGAYRESGFAVEDTYLRPVVEDERERERIEGRPQAVKDVEIIHGNECIGAFDPLPSPFTLQPPALTSIPEAGEMLINQARKSFNSYETADLIFNFHFRVSTTDQLTMPDLHLPGHRFVLGMSPTLAGCISQQQPVLQAGLRSDAPSFPLPTLSITIADPNLTPQAVLHAIQTMYGFSIIEQAPGTTTPRPLALIVAGFHLQLPQVMWAGVDLCVYNLTWNDVEQVIAFGLAGAVDLNGPIHPGLPAYPLPLTFFEYALPGGHHIRKLLMEVMGFMARKFPAGFKLDPSTADGQFPRIPAYPDQEMAMSYGTTAADNSLPSPPASKVTKGHRASASIADLDPRLSAIRFGDLSPPTDEEDAQANGTAARPVNGANDVSGIHNGEFLRSLLSRVLVNLPFDLLKYLLENPDLCHESGGISANDRKALMSQVLTERERRRAMARAAVLDCRVHQWDTIMQRLSQSDSPLMQPGDHSWDALAWREGMAVPQGGIPRVYRTWHPLITSSATSVGAHGFSG